MMTIPSFRNPCFNSTLNPRFNAAINPIYNAAINPLMNSAINPRFNSAINPIYNAAINPKFNAAINPKYNAVLNPQFNSQINPVYNSAINPIECANIAGFYVFDWGELNAVGTMIKASPKMYVMYSLTNVFTGFTVVASDKVLVRFDLDGNYSGELVENGTGNFNLYNANLDIVGLTA